MRRLMLTLPVLTAGLACTTHDAPLEPRADIAAARRLEIGDELAGSALKQTTDGPWQVRSTRDASTGASAADSKPGADRMRSAAAPSESMDTGLSMDMDLEGGVAPPATRTFEAESAAAPTSPAAGLELARSPTPELAREPGGDGGDKLRRLSLGDEPDSPVASTPAVQNLKAGSTDDNADYAAYLEFLGTWADRQGIQDLYQVMDVSDRRFVSVVDVDGRPVPGAVVSIIDEVADRVVWTATTYGDGRVPYYPHLDVMPVTVGEGGDGGGLLIEAFVRDADGTPRGVRAPWDGEATEVQVALPEAFEIPEPVQLDVCFVIDTTGSMGDEIESIKASLLKVTEKLRGLDREFDLRYSAVLYRDIGDEYVTATHAFTDDIEAFDKALRGVSANGGGDGPESLNQAVAQAVDGVDWREGAAKVAFLVADAPPHMDYAGDVPYGESARAALARGIRIHSVAASGLDAVGTLVFRQLAQFTRGKFIFIEYGTPAASAESHGVAGEVKRNNLEDILFEQIRDEVATFGRSR